MSYNYLITRVISFYQHKDKINLTLTLFSGVEIKKNINVKRTLNFKYTDNVMAKSKYYNMETQR